jgi:hypothetical protein
VRLACSHGGVFLNIFQVAAGWPGLREFEAALVRDHRPPSSSSSSSSCFVTPLALKHALAQSGVPLSDAAARDLAMGLGADADGRVDASEALQVSHQAVLERATFEVDLTLSTPFI